MKTRKRVAVCCALIAVSLASGACGGESFSAAPDPGVKPTDRPLACAMPCEKMCCVGPGARGLAPTFKADSTGTCTGFGMSLACDGTVTFGDQTTGSWTPNDKGGFTITHGRSTTACWPPKSGTNHDEC
jgi:hypothetical protein